MPGTLILDALMQNISTGSKKYLKNIIAKANSALQFKNPGSSPKAMLKPFIKLFISDQFSASLDQFFFLSQTLRKSKVVLNLLQFYILWSTTAVLVLIPQINK